jgi:hypothetical protein
VGDNLRSDDQMASMLAERASRGVEGVADYVASKDMRGLLRDTEQLARRQPALFFGSAFLVGLAIGRFLKNSPLDADTGSWRGNEDAERRTGALPEPRRASPASPSEPSQQRYRQNYDAAFGRDIPPAPAESSSPAAGSSATSAKSNPGVRNGEHSPESNGGRRSGKGKVS